MGLTIDGKTLDELGLELLKGHEHPGLPSTRDYTVTIPGMHGEYDYGAEMAAKPVTIPLLIKPKKNERDLAYAVRKTMGTFLDAYGKPKTLQVIFDYEPDVYYLARYSGSLPTERSKSMARIEIPLTVFKAWKYALVENHEINMDSDIVTFDDYYSMDTVFIDDVQITAPITLETYVNGYAVRPKILINGTGDNVTFQVNGKSFSLQNFANADWVIDGENYTVLKDGLNGLSQYIGSDFLELIPGSNFIQITGSNMNFNLSVHFRDQYM